MDLRLLTPWALNPGRSGARRSGGERPNRSVLCRHALGSLTSRACSIALSGPRRRGADRLGGLPRRRGSRRSCPPNRSDRRASSGAQPSWTPPFARRSVISPAHSRSHIGRPTSYILLLPRALLEHHLVTSTGYTLMQACLLHDCDILSPSVTYVGWGLRLRLPIRHPHHRSKRGGPIELRSESSVLIPSGAIRLKSQ